MKISLKKILMILLNIVALGSIIFVTFYNSNPKKEITKTSAQLTAPVNYKEIQESQINFCKAIKNNRKLIISNHWFMEDLPKNFETILTTQNGEAFEIHLRWNKLLNKSTPYSKFANSWDRDWKCSKTVISLSQKNILSACNSNEVEINKSIFDIIKIVNKNQISNQTAANFNNFVTSLND